VLFLMQHFRHSITLQSRCECAQGRHIRYPVQQDGRRHDRPQKTGSVRVTAATWMVMTGFALLVGAAVGVWLGRRGLLRELAARTRQAEKELQEQQSSAAESLRAVQAKVAKDLEDARARARAGGDAAAEAQRAEIEKLTRHLTEAYDELDQLRVRVAAAGHPQAPDTGQGFAATMPLGES
jgi:hypothetical protein